MKWIEFVEDYLTFTKKERIGILIVVALILITYFLPDIISSSPTGTLPQTDTAWMSAVKKLAIKDSGHEHRADNEDAFAYQYDRKKSNYAGNHNKGELFYFDPNTISPREWKRLGLRDKTIKIIENYLNKGGHFYKPEDLQKIFGFHIDDYKRLSPYVKIESVPAIFPDPSLKTERVTAITRTYTTKYSVIDINTADTSAFISLPGIGSKLASRIVSFREKLGGFYSVDQLGETYGLPDSTFQKIKQWLKLENPEVKKININTATVDELKNHPYIKLSIANPIVAYRTEHGAFSKIEDIRNVMAVTDEIYNKIRPYLTL